MPASSTVAHRRRAAGRARPRDQRPAGVAGCTARRQQRLVGVDVADAGDDALVEQRGLDRARRPASARASGRRVEAVVQRLGAEALVEDSCARRSPSSTARCRTAARRCRASVAPSSSSSRARRCGRLGQRGVGQVQERAGHAQVGDERVAALETASAGTCRGDRAAPRSSPSRRAATASGGSAPTSRGSRMATRSSRRPSRQRRQAAADGLDLGQLRHGP